MRAAQGAAGVVEEGNGGNDGLAGKPRKSWLMRKRQERAAIKEGLAEWQVGFGDSRITSGRAYVQAELFLWGTTGKPVLLRWEGDRAGRHGHFCVDDLPKRVRSSKWVHRKGCS